jgi:hypothetical protein
MGEWGHKPLWIQDGSKVALPYFGQAWTVFAWRAAHAAYWPSSSIVQACHVS